MQTPKTPGTDSAHHLTLIEQVQARRDELQRALTDDSTSASSRTNIEEALASVTPMLTGDLKTLPDMVSRDLTRWLETNKYVAVPPAAPAKPEVAVSGAIVVPPQS